MVKSMKVLVIDLGIPVNVLELYVERRDEVVFKELQKINKFIDEATKYVNVFVGVSILNPYREVDGLEELEEKLGLVFLPIVQITSGVQTFSILSHQIDLERDDVGSICPTNGREELKHLSESFLNRFKAFAIDITDMFIFSSKKGLASCLCSSCINAISSILRSGGVDPDRVIDAIHRGDLRYIVRSESEGSFSTYPLYLMDYGDDVYIFRGLSENRLKILGLLYLFIKARSILVAKMISDTFSGGSGYRAVFLEGGSGEGITSVFSKTVVENVDIQDIDFYIGLPAVLRILRLDKDKQNVGVYSLFAGRYLVGQLSESMWRYVSTAMYLYKRDEDACSNVLEGMRREMIRRYNKLMTTALNSYMPRLEDLARQKINYAVYGLQPVMKIAKHIVETIEDFAEYSPQEIDEIFYKRIEDSSEER